MSDIMSQANYENPKIYKPLPEEMFRSVERINALNRDGWSVAAWAKDQQPDSELEEALQPMIESIQAVVPDIEEMNIEAFTISVPPASAQIDAAGMWHWDGRTRFMMAASLMPTKVLYIPDGLSDTEREQALMTISSAEYGRWNLEETKIEQGIKIGMFAVAQAEQYGMIDMDGMIHQSPTNPTNRTLYRTFLRADVMQASSLTPSSH